VTGRAAHDEPRIFFLNPNYLKLLFYARAEFYFTQYIGFIRLTSSVSHPSSSPRKSIKN